MKSRGRQCVDLEKICHWNEKTHRVSMLNLLHFQACSPQESHTGVRGGIGLCPGWAWACTKAPSQTRLPWDGVLKEDPRL